MNVPVKSEISRIASYGIVMDNSNILLCRLSAAIPDKQGWWTLPGGGVDFGEHPEAAMIREIHEETGYHVRTKQLLGVDSIVRENANDRFHAIRIIHTAEIVGGSLRFEQDGTTDRCEWHPVTAITSLDVVDLVETALAMLEGKKG